MSVALDNSGNDTTHVAWKFAARAAAAIFIAIIAFPVMWAVSTSLKVET